MQESQQNDSKQLDWYAPSHGLERGSSKPKSKRDRLVWSWNHTGKTQASRKWTSIHQAYKHAINRGQLANSWSQHVSPIHIWFHLMERSFQRCGLHNARPMQPRRHRKNDQQSEPASSPKPGSRYAAKQTAPTFKDFVVGTGYRNYGICMKFRESLDIWKQIVWLSGLGTAFFQLGCKAKSANRQWQLRLWVICCMNLLRI